MAGAGYWAQAMAEQGRRLVVDSTCNFREVLEHGYECRVEDINVLEGRLGARGPLPSQRTSVHRPPLDASDARGGEKTIVRSLKGG